MEQIQIAIDSMQITIAALQRELNNFKIRLENLEDVNIPSDTVLLDRRRQNDRERQSYEHEGQAEPT